MAFIDSLDKK